MIKKNRISLIALFCVSWMFLSACSPNTTTKEFDNLSKRDVIFGADDFREVGPLSQSNPWYDRVRATASIFKGAVTCADGNCELGTNSFDNVTFPPTGHGGSTQTLPLCSGEQFEGQPQGANCTGFLIDEDLMVTAGHCVKTASACGQMKIVFDFIATDDAGLQVNTTVPESAVYTCKEVLVAVSQGSDIDNDDFAIVRLNRPVLDRTPLALRQNGDVTNGAPMGTVGSYHGLSLKISDNAVVKNNPLDMPRFETNLDSGKGSSGSPVFGLDTNLVEGILVSGPVSKNYEKFTKTDGSKCARAIRCSDEDGCDTNETDSSQQRDWVKVTRISSVVDFFEGRSCYDEQLSSEETDVDCGGPKCAVCLPDMMCQEDSDCGLPGISWQRPSCWAAKCGQNSQCEIDTNACECQEDTHCDDGIACTTNHCSALNSCFFSVTDECVSCKEDIECIDENTPTCVVPQCTDTKVCNNDTSACECTDDSHCSDDIPSTQDVCDMETLSCHHIDTNHPSTNWEPKQGAANFAVSTVALTPANQEMAVVGYDNGDVYMTISDATSEIPSWTKVDESAMGAALPNKLISSIAISPLDSRTIYVAFFGCSYSGNLWMSRSGGQYWNEVTTGPYCNITNISINPLDSSIVYVNDNTGKVFTSLDYGNTWTEDAIIDPLKPAAATGNISTVAISQSSFSKVMVGTDTGEIWMSFNAQDSNAYWMKVTGDGYPYPDFPAETVTSLAWGEHYQPAISYVAFNSLFTGKSLWKNSNGNNPFGWVEIQNEQLPSHTAIATVSLNPAFSSVLYATTTYTEYNAYKSEDNGLTWTVSP